MREFQFGNLMENKYSGPEYERDLIGVIKTDDPGYREELFRLQKIAQARGYRARQGNSLPFREAAEITKKFQPEDTTNPQKDFARELRLALAEKLDLENDEDMNRLGFYTAVGGPLDAHGIDGFFTYLYPDKEKRVKEGIVSFDITKNPKKDEASKADLLIGGDISDPSDADFKEEEYLAKIGEYADRIAEIFKGKISRGEAGFTRALH